MALNIQVNPQYKDQVVCHNKVAAKKVGEHTQEELLQLGIIARSSGNPILLRCFDNLPTMDELMKEKTESDIKAVKDNVVSKPAEVAPAAAPTTK